MPSYKNPNWLYLYNAAKLGFSGGSSLHLEETPLNESVLKDLQTSVSILARYAEDGRAISSFTEDMEPTMARALRIDLLKPLTLVHTLNGTFGAVDCSSIPLLVGQNFGAYVLRVSSAIVNRDRQVTLSHKEHVFTVTGDELKRQKALEAARSEYESQMGLFLTERLVEKDYLLLDGVSFFGGPRRFSVDLYEKAKQRKINLLTLAKNTKAMTAKGTDFITTLLVERDFGTWLYHPYLKADIKEHRYGDISFVKLHPSALAAFRCDIPEYLTENDIGDLVSPLTALAEDARCLGYPVCLFLAHRNTQVPSPKMLYYRDELEKMLAAQPFIYRKILLEEKVSSFRRQMYGVKNIWDWEKAGIV